MNETIAKKVYLRTFGCQMNVRDSEVICGLLKKNNFILTENPHEAEIIIFNTCSVRKHAEDRVWSEIGKYKKFIVDSSKLSDKKLRTTNHEVRTKPIIGLVGCMAQAYKEKVFTKAPQVDFVVGPNDIHKIPEIISKIKSMGDGYSLFRQKIYETEGNLRPEEIYHTGIRLDKEHAYVIISEGCSNYCSYCIVPYVRGNLRNRNYKDILREIEETVDKGINKITLLGQNVNAYEYDGVDFVKLIELVNAVEGLEEFSFITSHPKDTSIDLFKTMANLEKIKKYLHLPVQSGSDRILNLMNRGYTRKYYLNLVDNYRKIVKEGILTTDIIVGFPTESEGDFLDTYNLVKEIEFDASFIFKYSPRPFTDAEKLPDDVPKEEKERRHEMILNLQKEISRKKKSKNV